MPNWGLWSNLLCWIDPRYRQCLVKGMRYASVVVFAFNLRKSMTIRHFLLPYESNFFGTIQTRKLYWDSEFCIMPFSIKFPTWFFISVLWTSGYRYCFVFIGFPSVVNISCCRIDVCPSWSPGIWNKNGCSDADWQTCSVSL